jgi:hypothetical protein
VAEEPPLAEETVVSLEGETATDPEHVAVP